MTVRLRLVVLLTAAWGSAGSTEAKVHKLTSKNFAKKTATGDWFVHFYDPDSDKCKKVEVDFRSLADRLAKDENNTVNLAKMDATVERRMLYRFNMWRIPWFLMFTNGEMKVYSGPFLSRATGRIEDRMYDWVTDEHKAIKSKPLPPEPSVLGDLILKFGLEARVLHLIQEIKSMDTSKKEGIVKVLGMIRKAITTVAKSMPQLLSDKKHNEALMAMLLIGSVMLVFSAVGACFCCSFLYICGCTRSRKKEKTS